MELCQCKNKHRVETGIAFCSECDKPKYDISQIANARMDEEMDKWKAKQKLAREKLSELDVMTRQEDEDEPNKRNK
jgi:hypothetical protein